MLDGHLGIARGFVFLGNNGSGGVCREIVLVSFFSRAKASFAWIDCFRWGTAAKGSAGISREITRFRSAFCALSSLQFRRFVRVDNFWRMKS
jgi:hypothetical protein